MDKIISMMSDEELLDDVNTLTEMIEIGSYGVRDVRLLEDCFREFEKRGLDIQKRTRYEIISHEPVSDKDIIRDKNGNEIEQ